MLSKMLLLWISIFLTFEKYISIKIIKLPYKAIIDVLVIVD